MSLAGRRLSAWFDSKLTPVLGFAISRLSDHRTTRWLAVLAARVVYKRFQNNLYTILTHGTARDIQRIGQIMQRSEVTEFNTAGAFCEQNAEKFILRRVLGRWPGP